ncbi:MAG TPA: hypothetical protein IGS37_16045 [Synechococcales cyanobacterium M55_K2018_004]|nr:hypothetical protein [Synechococcales cyanobacterium M55_K2018_004]
MRCLTPFGLGLTTIAVIAIAGCDTVTTTQYQAIAITRYTWLVDYYDQNRSSDRPPRIEAFASTELTNENGQHPPDAVTGPDDRGLWWPALPPRPTVDELEARQRPQETIGTPRLNKSVEYFVTFRNPGEPNRTLPTRYEIYRQVVRSYEQRQPLQFVLGINNGSVENVVPQ